VRAVVTDDVMMGEGVNDRVQLAQLGAEMNCRTLERHMRSGVTVVDPATTWIDADVSIGQDAVILPGVQLHGATDIGEEAVIGPHTTLRHTEVGPGAEGVRSPALLTGIGAGADFGPFSYFTAGTNLDATARSAASSRPRTPRSARARRSRTSATSAMRRSARARTS